MQKTLNPINVARLLLEMRRTHAYSVDFLAEIWEGIVAYPIPETQTVMCDDFNRTLDALLGIGQRKAA